MRLRGVRKAYRLYPRPADRLLEAITRRPRHRELLALDGIDLDVGRGEVLGVIGENGAGKSTLLKLVAGITEPTAGTVETRGAVASILELGAGFHGEFSGRENARLNAAILGVPTAEIPPLLERTKEFSELGHFFERPVRTYSSGMVMRLAFTVATEVDPEILIIDEALAVGDGHFQKKSIDRIAAFRDAGKTILFCTHALYFVQTLCRRAIWIESGKLRREGEAPDVVREYENHLLEKDPKPAAADAAASFDHAVESPAEGAEARAAVIESARVLDGSGRPARELRPGDELRIEVDAAVRDPARGLHLRIGIDRSDGVQVFAADTRRDGRAPARGALRHRFTYRIPAFPVRSGVFSVFVFLGDETALHLYDHVLLRDAIEVTPAEFDVGLLEIPREWRCEAL